MIGTVAKRPPNASFRMLCSFWTSSNFQESKNMRVKISTKVNPCRNTKYMVHIGSHSIGNKRYDCKWVTSICYDALSIRLLIASVHNSILEIISWIHFVFLWNPMILIDFLIVFWNLKRTSHYIYHLSLYNVLP